MPPRVAAALFILVLWTACSVERSAIAPGSGGEDTGVSSMDARPDSVPDAPATDAVVPRDAPRDVADIGTGCPPALGADCRWTSRMRLTFDNAGQDEELTDFPVMVALSEPRLDFADLQDAGEDLRFLDATATQVLPHEIEIWNEAARSVVWVRVPRIGANSTTDHVWVYYGHPDAPDAQDAGSVWSDGFELVWHLSGSFADSTSASNDGSNVGTTNAAGRLGRGRAFDGRGQYVDSDYDTELTTVTVEAWARGDDVPRSGQNVGVVGRDRNYQLNWDHFSDFRGAFGLRAGDWQAASYLPVSAFTWHYLAGSYDGDTIRAYRDGTLTGENPALSGLPDSDSVPLRVGTSPDPSDGWFFSGRIDEVRVSRVVRSPAWIRAQSLSMNDDFITYGAPERITPPG